MKQKYLASTLLVLECLLFLVICLQMAMYTGAVSTYCIAIPVIMGSMAILATSLILRGKHPYLNAPLGRKSTDLGMILISSYFLYKNYHESQYVIWSILFVAISLVDIIAIHKCPPTPQRSPYNNSKKLNVLTLCQAVVINLGAILFAIKLWNSSICASIMIIAAGLTFFLIYTDKSDRYRPTYSILFDAIFLVVTPTYIIATDNILSNSIIIVFWVFLLLDLVRGVLNRKLA